MSTGIIYILSNPGLFDPDTKEPIYKIGITQDLNDRLSRLYSSGVPFPFQCIFACEVENYDRVEKDLHIAFVDYRVNKNREFFSIKPELLIPLLKHFVGFKEITFIVEEEIGKFDDTTNEEIEIHDNYDIYDNLKKLLNLPDDFSPGLFCYRVSKLHGTQKKKTYKINGKQYYDKDVFLEEARKENISINYDQI